MKPGKPGHCCSGSSTQRSEPWQGQKTGGSSSRRQPFGSSRLAAERSSSNGPQAHSVAEAVVLCNSCYLLGNKIAAGADSGALKASGLLRKLDDWSLLAAGGAAGNLIVSKFERGPSRSCQGPTLQRQHCHKLSSERPAAHSRKFARPVASQLKLVVGAAH